MTSIRRIRTQDGIGGAGLKSAAAVAVCMLLAIGCGRKVNLPDRAPVKGKVTLDGKPLTRGTVTFVPDHGKGTRGPVAIGTIDAEGNYTLTTDRSGTDGAMVGFHKIRVEAREASQSDTETLPKPLIPMRYFDSDQSGLTAEVKAGQENVVDLELKSKT